MSREMQAAAELLNPYPYANNGHWSATEEQCHLGTGARSLTGGLRHGAMGYGWFVNAHQLDVGDETYMANAGAYNVVSLQERAVMRHLHGRNVGNVAMTPYLHPQTQDYGTQQISPAELTKAIYTSVAGLWRAAAGRAYPDWEG
jgi:hypothetical protein